MKSIAMLLLTLACTPVAAALCSAPQPRLVCAEYFDSTAVVVARLEKIEAIRSREDPEGIDAYVYTLKTQRTLRGNIDEEFEFYEYNDSGRAGFRWKAGTEYLLFLFPWNEPKGTWALDGCGNSSPMQGSASMLKQVAALASSSMSSGILQASIFNGTPGVKLRIVGPTTKTATTNKDGIAAVRVAAGAYSVRSAQTSVSLKTYTVSYSDARHVVVPAGGCAQVSLELADSPVKR